MSEKAERESFYGEKKKKNGGRNENLLSPSGPDHGKEFLQWMPLNQSVKRATLMTAPLDSGFFGGRAR